MIQPHHLMEKEKQVEKNEAQANGKGIVLKPLKSKWKPNIGPNKDTNVSNSGLTDQKKESTPVDPFHKNIGGKELEPDMQQVVEMQEAIKTGTHVSSPHQTNDSALLGNFDGNANVVDVSSPKDHSNTN
ncbi:OLC1v1025662C1 [Oldenlandia corymbosa var. corymbosa]|uniref:OLC1v1025662C1 n=1 Tax=Oldenlandia corymbosa var. corymbosa TaxID=529605 RepID=A0AAV1C582_OLDCO|nr:OLC1v1025662C1 [Oldenlandia corymbosa var. corymbosa]